MKNRTGGIYEADTRRAALFPGLLELREKIHFFSPIVLRECVNSGGCVDRFIIGRRKISMLDPVF